MKSQFFIFFRNISTLFISWFGNLSLIILFFFVTSCNSDRLFDKFENIPAESWDKNLPVTFRAVINDTITPVNVIIFIRHNGEYPKSNLYLFVKTTSPLGFSMKDTVLCTLANEKGKWLGSGFGSIWTHKILYKKNVKFPFHGVYVFEFEQAMRDNPLPGIIDVGLRIQKAKIN